MWKHLFCSVILALASVSLPAAGAEPDAYPNRQIRIIDGFPPGGGTDLVGRILAAKLAERFGQPVIVENRPGAGGNIGADTTAHARPDGYTLSVVASTSLAPSRSLYPNLGYDLLKDFAFVSRVATGAQVLVANPSVPAKSVAELVALARSKPNALRYGSAGVGSAGHLTMELLLSRTGIELLHVPYKGAAPAVTAVVAGEVDFVFASAPSTMPMVQAKRLNVLAVSSGKRLATFPDIPTIAESGVPDYSAPTTTGILAPIGTPPAVVKLLNAEIQKILQMDDVKAQLAAQGLEAAGSTSEEWRAIMETEVALWARLIKDSKIVAN